MPTPQVDQPDSFDMTCIKLGRLGRSVKAAERTLPPARFNTDDSVDNRLYPVGT
jgi:hypothetical protein